MGKCNREIDLTLVKASTDAVIHEQRKISRKVEEVEDKVDEVKRSTKWNRHLVVFFGLVGLLVQWYKG